MPCTLSLCSLTLSLTFCPKILKPARAISATTPTRMMYSTRFAPRRSRSRLFFARVSLSFGLSITGLLRGSGRSREGGSDRGAGRLEVLHQAGPHRHEGEHQPEAHGADEHEVLGRHRAARVARELARGHGAHDRTEGRAHATGEP